MTRPTETASPPLPSIFDTSSPTHSRISVSPSVFSTDLGPLLADSPELGGAARLEAGFSHSSDQVSMEFNIASTFALGSFRSGGEGNVFSLAGFELNTRISYNLIPQVFRPFAGINFGYSWFHVDHFRSNLPTLRLPALGSGTLSGSSVLTGGEVGFSLLNGAISFFGRFSALPGLSPTQVHINESGIHSSTIPSTPLLWETGWSAEIVSLVNLFTD